MAKRAIRKVAPKPVTLESWLTDQVKQITKAVARIEKQIERMIPAATAKPVRKPVKRATVKKARPVARSSRAARPRPAARRATSKT